MDRRYATSRWLLALVAMLFALFVVSPSLNAVACAVELDPAHASATLDSDQSHQSGGDALHGTSGHGHCHHGVKEAAEASTPAPVPPTRTLHQLSPDAGRPSFAPDGLMRPPRA